MNRERKVVYSPPIIKTVSFVVEMGLTLSTTNYVPMTGDDDLPGIHSNSYGSDDWSNNGNSTTSYEMERW